MFGITDICAFLITLLLITFAGSHIASFLIRTGGQYERFLVRDKEREDKFAELVKHIDELRQENASLKTRFSSLSESVSQARDKVERMERTFQM